MMNPIPEVSYLMRTEARYDALSQQLGGREWGGQLWVFAEVARHRKRAEARRPGLQRLLRACASVITAALPLKTKKGAVASITSEAGADATTFQSEWPALALLDRATPLLSPCQVEIVDGAGICPRQWKVGDMLKVDQDGRLSAPICRTAVETLNPLLLAASEQQGFEPRASCLCPLPLRHLTFAVRPAEHVNPN